MLAPPTVTQVIYDTCCNYCGEVTIQAVNICPNCGENMVRTVNNDGSDPDGIDFGDQNEKNNEADQLGFEPMLFLEQMDLGDLDENGRKPSYQPRMSIRLECQ